jgi:hypothetical protein
MVDQRLWEEQVIGKIQLVQGGREALQEVKVLAQIKAVGWHERSQAQIGQGNGVSLKSNTEGFQLVIRDGREEV